MRKCNSRNSTVRLVDIDHFDLSYSTAICHTPKVQCLRVPRGENFDIKVCNTVGKAVLNMSMLVPSVCHLFFHTKNKRFVGNSRVFAVIYLMLPKLYVLLS